MPARPKGSKPARPTRYRQSVHSGQARIPRRCRNQHTARVHRRGTERGSLTRPPQGWTHRSRTPSSPDLLVRASRSSSLRRTREGFARPRASSPMTTAWGSLEPRRARPNARSSPEVPWLKTGLSKARNDSSGRPRRPPGNNNRTRSRISGIHILPANKGFHPSPSYLGTGGPDTPETRPDARKKADSHQDTIFPFTACLHPKSSDNAPFSYRVRPV